MASGVARLSSPAGSTAGRNAARTPPRGTSGAMVTNSGDGQPLRDVVEHQRHHGDQQHGGDGREPQGRRAEGDDRPGAPPGERPRRGDRRGRRCAPRRRRRRATASGREARRSATACRQRSQDTRWASTDAASTGPIDPSWKAASSRPGRARCQIRCRCHAHVSASLSSARAAHHAGLHGSRRDAEEPGRLVRGQAVEDGGLHHGPQLRREPLEGDARLAVLDTEQHLLLGRRVCSDWWPADARGAARAAACADAGGGGAGGWRCPTATPPPRRGRRSAGRAPDGDEGVLHDLLDDLAIGATAGDPGGEPRLVALVQLGERRPITLGHRREHLGVGAPAAGHTRCATCCRLFG